VYDTLSTRLTDLLRLIGQVLAVVFTLDLDNHLVNGLGLLLPLGLAHLELLLEQLVVGLPVTSAQTVPEGGELAVVVVEVQMVHGVACSAVDKRRVVGILAVVDQDCPDVDEDEEGDVGKLLEREEEGEDMVRQTLGIAIHGVEGVRGKGRGHDPLVVGLVQRLVNALVVESTVNPVDTEIGEEEEEGKLGPVVPGTGALLCGIVELRVAADFSQEPGRSEDGHDREGDVGLLHLETDLVFEVSGMVEGTLVEDEVVGQRGENVVYNDTKQPVCGELANGGITGSKTGAHHVMRYRETSWRRQSSRGHWLW
jgi:hypothetical protein